MAYWHRDSRRLFNIDPYGRLQLEVVVVTASTKAKAAATSLNPYEYSMVGVSTVPTTVETTTIQARVCAFSCTHFSSKLVETVEVTYICERIQEVIVARQVAVPERFI